MKVMKRLWRRISLIFFTIVVILAAFPNNAFNESNSNSGENSGNNASVDIASDIMVNKGSGGGSFVKVAENSSYEMSINKKDASLIIKNKQNNNEWASTPADYMNDKKAAGIAKMSMASQLIIKYSDKSANINVTTSKVSSVNKKGMSITDINNGVRVTYKFIKEGFEIPVEYTLENDFLKTDIIVDKIKETNSKYLLCTIGLLPYLGAGGKKDEGYMFVPDGCGAIINFNNNKPVYGDYQQFIYDRDAAISINEKSTVAKSARMPVFGIKNGNRAFAAVIASGASRAVLNASVSGSNTSYNNIYSEFIYRDSDSISVKEKSWDSKQIRVFEDNPTQISHYTVNYYFLENDQANYTGMALRYQKYLEEEKGLKSSVENDYYPFYVDLFGGVKRLEHILGFPVKKEVPLTKYSDAVMIAKQLKENGINDLVLKYDAWTQGGPDNSIPVDLKSEKALGGKQEFDNMSGYMSENGVKLFLDVNLTDMYKNRWGYNKVFDAAKSIDKSPGIQYRFKLSTYQKNTDYDPLFLLNPDKVGSAAIEINKNIENYNIRGLSLTTLGQKLYSDFIKKGLDRGKAEQIWEDAIKRLKNSKGSIMFEEPNGYAVPYATNISSVPIESSRYSIEDYEIPFYEIVLHGFVSYSLPPVNMYSDYRKCILKALETGSSLNFLWIAENIEKLRNTPYDYLYSVRYGDWIKDAADSYKEVADILRGVAKQRIIAHETLEEGVVRTTYENGLKITVNYNDKPSTIENREIAADSYEVSGGR